MILMNLQIMIKTVLEIMRILMMITMVILIQLRYKKVVTHLIQRVYLKMQIKTDSLMLRRLY